MTWAAFGQRKLALLCDGLGLSHECDAAIDRFNRLTQGWSQWEVGNKATWENDITDDCTPFEFSVVFEGSVPTIRVLIEAQERPIGPLSSWSAGLALNESVRYQAGVSLARFEQVRPLFEPSGQIPIRFSMWHAASLTRRADASLKVYLNPRVRGPGAAKSIVREALQRLQIPEAWDFLAARLAVRHHRDQLIYFSLDLSSAADARVKIYVAHPGATADELDTILQGCRDHANGDASHWISQLVGTSGPFKLRPLLTCFSFAGGVAPRATVHIPVRCYCRNDAEILEQTCGLLDASQGSRLRKGLQQVAGRPLDAGPGIVTYVSVRRISHSLNVTTYIAPEAYSLPL